MFSLGANTSFDDIKMKSFNKLILVVNFNSSCKDYVEMFANLQELKPEFTYVSNDVD